MAKQDINPFSSPSAETDLVLLVEEEKLYVSKLVLSLVSPVFKRMLGGDYKEKHSAMIPLPEKRLEDVLEFLLCVYPTTVKPVTRRNLECLLSLADEYSVDSLKQRCEAFILSRFHHSDDNISNPCNDELVHFTVLGDRYRLKGCVEACIGKLVGRPYQGPSGIKYAKEFDLLSTELKFQMVDKRLSLLEAPCRDISEYAQCLDIENIGKMITNDWCRCFDPESRFPHEGLCRYKAQKVAHIIQHYSQPLFHNTAIGKNTQMTMLPFLLDRASKSLPYSRGITHCVMNVVVLQ